MQKSRVLYAQLGVRVLEAVMYTLPFLGLPDIHRLVEVKI